MSRKFPRLGLPRGPARRRRFSSESNSSAREALSCSTPFGAFESVFPKRD